MRSSDALFHLIKSMTKGDRRNFKLFARLQEGDKNYVALFDAIARQDEYDEKAILAQFKGERFTNQFSVAKNYLYNFILKTLHIFHKDQQTELNTLMHQIQILMGKNLYDQAHKLVRKAKHMAERQERFQEMLYLLQYERECLHERQKGKEYLLFIDELMGQEFDVIRKIQNYAEYKQLNDRITILLRERELRKSDNHEDVIAELQQHPLLRTEDSALSIRAKVKYLNAKVEINRYIRAFDVCNGYSLQLLILLEANPMLLQEKMDTYLQYLVNYAIYQYRLGDSDGAIDSIEKIRGLKFVSQKDRLTAFEYYYLWRLLWTIERRDFSFGRKLVGEIESKLVDFVGQLSKAKELLFYYYISYFWQLSGEAKLGLRSMARLLNEALPDVRMDLQCMARILNLILLLDFGDRKLFDGAYKSATRFLSNRNALDQFERMILSYLKRLSIVDSNEESRFYLHDMDKELKKVELNGGLESKKMFFDFQFWIQQKLEFVKG